MPTLILHESCAKKYAWQHEPQKEQPPHIFHLHLVDQCCGFEPHHDSHFTSGLIASVEAAKLPGIIAKKVHSAAASIFTFLFKFCMSSAQEASE